MRVERRPRDGDKRLPKLFAAGSKPHTFYLMGFLFFFLRSSRFKIPPWAQLLFTPTPHDALGAPEIMDFLGQTHFLRHSHPLDGRQSGRSWAAAQFHTPKPSHHLLRYYYFSLIKWGIAGNYTVGAHSGSRRRRMMPPMRIYPRLQSQFPVSQISELDMKFIYSAASICNPDQN